MEKPFKLISYFNKLKIRKQLFLIYFFAGIIPVFVIGMYLLLVTQRLVMHQHQTQLNAENVRVSNIIFNVTSSLVNISDEIYKDDDLKRIISTKYSSESEFFAACRSYAKLSNYQQYYAEIASIDLYTTNKTMQDYEHFKIATDEIKNTFWYKKAMNSVYESFWVTTEYVDDFKHSSAALTLVRKIPLQGSNVTAILKICVSDNYLKLLINNSSLKTEASVSGYPVFFTNNAKNNLKSLGFEFPESSINKYVSFSGIGVYDGKEVLYKVSTMRPSLPARQPDKIHIVTLDYEALPDQQKFNVICICIMSFSLLVPLIMILLFSNAFSRRINLLRNQMHQVSKGDYNIIEKFNGNDEVFELFCDLQTMIREIKELDAQIYTQKLRQEQLINHQQEIKFELLSSQINPHFLYNTLESIRMKAHSAGDKDVANAIKLLGKAMRHSLEVQGKPTSLSSELEYIQNYLEIQKFRFGDKIHYEIKVSPEINCEEYMILPLLIQPIVENAISHGLEDVDSGGFISIKIEKENDKIKISASDNGCGMSERKLRELLEWINTPEPENKTGSIGLRNVNQRIKIFYGEDYGVSITSVLGKGTTVKLTLPFDLEGKK